MDTGSKLVSEIAPDLFEGSSHGRVIAEIHGIGGCEIGIVLDGRPVETNDAICAAKALRQRAANISVRASNQNDTPVHGSALDLIAGRCSTSVRSRRQPPPFKERLLYIVALTTAGGFPICA